MRDGTVERWVALDVGRMREAFVGSPRLLSELVLEERPSAPTLGGAPHEFDPATLARFAAALGPLARRRLRLPITFFLDKELPGDAYVQDETAIELLRALGEVPAELGARDGRLWLSHARARDVAQRHRGAFQFSYL